MDPYQDGPKTSTIISLLVALCIFGGLYIVIPRYLAQTPILETDSLVTDAVPQVNPIPSREYPAQSMSAPVESNRFDELFSAVEKSMQHEHCMHFTQLDYTRAWLHTCSKKSQVTDSCVAVLSQAMKGNQATLLQSLNSAMSGSCGCTLTQSEGRAIEDMLKRSQKMCNQKYSL